MLRTIMMPRIPNFFADRYGITMALFRHVTPDADSARRCEATGRFCRVDTSVAESIIDAPTLHHPDMITVIRWRRTRRGREPRAWRQSDHDGSVTRSWRRSPSYGTEQASGDSRSAAAEQTRVANLKTSTPGCPVWRIFRLLDHGDDCAFSGQGPTSAPFVSQKRHGYAPNIFATFRLWLVGSIVCYLLILTARTHRQSITPAPTCRNMPYLLQSLTKSGYHCRAGGGVI